MRRGLGPEAVEGEAVAREVGAQHPVEGGEDGPVGAEGAVERMAMTAGDELGAAAEEPRLRPAEELVAAAADEVGAGGEQRGEGGVIGELRRPVGAQEAAPFVHEEEQPPAPGEAGERRRARLLDEAGDPVVRGVDLEEERGLGGQRPFVVGEPGPVRRPDLHEPGAGGGEDLGDPERAADLDELAARDDHLPPGGEGREHEHERRRVVVDDQPRLGAGQRREQGAGPGVPVAAPAAREVELEVAAGVEEPGEGRGHAPGERRPAEVRVQEHAARVEHPAQRGAELRGEGRGGRSRERGHGGLQLAGAGELAAGEPFAQAGESVAELDGDPLPSV
ncbi:MAG: hypothetical protein BWX64_02387 [Acidobacteria bacterium ADurb.Bin051]|nr:MAG: hypothetical protein BWX64_02387 [Acidobacteria bacterium ADurb.Bin051]